MKYKPTTVYLDPEDHARLKAQAAARGISLAELLREITSGRVDESAPQYPSKGSDAIIGVATSDEPTDVARKKDEYLAEAMDDLHKKKTSGAPARPRTMLRTQIQLDVEQAATLKRLAAEQGVSMASLIRQAVDHLIRGSERARMVERALAACGTVASGEPTLAEEHDHAFSRAIESRP